MLRKLLAAAAGALGRPVERAVVTVPAYFDDQQRCACAASPPSLHLIVPHPRRATEEAARLAGVQSVRLLREPVAAALAYGVGRLGDAVVLVADLGGGTFDVSLLLVGGGTVEVLATSGDALLGGDDFDDALARWLAKEATPVAAGTRRMHPRSLQRAARALREQLSQRESVTARLPGCADVTLTRAECETLLEPLLRRMRHPI